MGRRKGSKNKPKVIHHDDNTIREAVTPSNRSNDSMGISILDLSEEVTIRQVPTIKHSIGASRTKGVEKRITSLVSRHKSFYLETDVLTEHSEYFIDSGGWAAAKQLDMYVILIGHIKNLLPFLGGPHPVWQQAKRSYIKRTVRRGIHLG